MSLGPVWGKGLGGGSPVVVIQSQSLLLDTPGPQAINQYTRTVVVRWRIVGALDPDMPGWYFCAHEGALVAVWFWHAATTQRRTRHDCTVGVFNAHLMIAACRTGSKNHSTETA